jgi:Stage V sporulation protein S (SpoVS)
VSGESKVKAVAGKIAHAAREGEPPAVLAIGNSCLNQAVKVSSQHTCPLSEVVASWLPCALVLRSSTLYGLYGQIYVDTILFSCRL